MTQEEHLDKIVAKCRELLAVAEKRTPGKWNLHPDYEDRPIVVEPSEGGSAWVAWERKIAKGKMIIGSITAHSDSGTGYPRVRDRFENNANADFISSCAGSAEAGWQATIAKCEFIKAYRKIRFGYDGDCGATRLVDELESALTAAWPEELL